MDLVVSTKEQDQLIVETAAKLSIVEVGLGALVHGFKIPLGGHLLSLNQGFFLTRLVKQTKHLEAVRRSPFYASSVSALLKSLSPVGNKLGPMVAISVQGILFTLPVLLLGANLLSVILGMALLSVWAFAQPFVTLYLFFGHSLVEAIVFYLEKMQTSLGEEPEWIWLTNPICGDHVQIKLNIVDDQAKDLGYSAKSCALCSASASLMREEIGREPSISKLEQTARDFENAIMAAESSEWPSSLTFLQSFEHLRVNPTRRACALLPWIALKSLFQPLHHGDR